MREWVDIPSVDLALLLAVALVPPLTLWCGLAARRAVREDLSRGPRRARSRLLHWCAEVKRRDRVPTRNELIAWREGVRELWRIEAAAPTAEILATRGGGLWGQLWDEAETALFSRKGKLSADWLARAEEAVAELRLQRTASLWPTRVRHWLPMLILAAVGINGLVPPLHAAPEKVSTAQRIDRATALMQTEKWDAAHACWTAAFLHEPRNVTIRAGLRETMLRVAAADTTTRRLVQGRWFERIAGFATPAEWRAVAWSGTVLLSAALCSGLWLAYAGARKNRRALRALSGFAFLGATSAVGGWLAFRNYGVLAHPMLACVASIAEVRPVASDVVPRAQAATLLPGAIVVIDRSFLGWDHIISADGRTVGWMRSEVAVWAYRKRDDGRLSQVYFRTSAD